MRSIESVCLSVCPSFHLCVFFVCFRSIFCTDCPLTFSFACLWLMTMARMALKFEVIGQWSRSKVTVNMRATRLYAAACWLLIGCCWRPQQYVATVTSSAAGWPGEAPWQLPWTAARDDWQYRRGRSTARVGALTLSVSRRSPIELLRRTREWLNVATTRVWRRQATRGLKFITACRWCRCQSKPSWQVRSSLARSPCRRRAPLSTSTTDSQVIHWRQTDRSRH